MADAIKTDICIIGAGSGGLSVAAGASQMGAKTILIERGEMGGDCLNSGCVPSKSLIAAAKKAHMIRKSAAFGIQSDGPPSVDTAKVRDHVKGVIAAIAPHDSVDRFEGLGVDVIQAEARFVSPTRVETDQGHVIEAKHFVIATGSRAMVPPIPGLNTVAYLTNESVFDIDDAVGRLVVLGGGPIGVELAQAHQRLGAEVTIVELFEVLGREDKDCAGVVKRRLVEDGVTLKEKSKVVGVEKSEHGIHVRIETETGEETLEADKLLVAAGRVPNIDTLNLEAAGIAYTAKGITVDAGLRTSAKRISAIGDVAGGLQFTHMAGYHAGIIIRRLLFKMFWAKTTTTAFPWVTYTDPEIAHVGMNEAQARETFGKGNFRVLRWSFDENDRAQAERQTEGLIKVITDPKGRIKGATIAGPHAGELIMPWVMAIADNKKIGAIAGLVFPYPTFSEISKRAAGSYFTPTLFSEKTRKIVRFLMKLS